jgi:head-tail adaptor
MVAGSLHDRVRFERRANTADDFGNTEGVWETLVETRARIKVLSGREPELADKAESILVVDVTVRYQGGRLEINEGMHDAAPDPLTGQRRERRLDGVEPVGPGRYEVIGLVGMARQPGQNIRVLWVA